MGSRNEYIVILAAALIFIGWVVYEIFPRSSDALLALPSGATEINEQIVDIGIQDYIHCLKAKVSPAEFDLFAKDLGLATKYNEDNQTYWPMEFQDQTAPAWWTPTPAFDGVVYSERRGKAYIEFAKYENGYLYFMGVKY